MTNVKPFKIYNASAGSGKTYTLVREFIVLALSEQRPDAFRSILAITFTNKASAEMKARVLDALEKMANEHPKTAHLVEEIAKKMGIKPELLPEKAANLLRSIMHQYGDFSIGTIDSFMHRVVRTFAYDLHLPVSFSVELDKTNLIKQAIDQILDLAGEDEAITEVLLGYNQNRSEDEKNTDISAELQALANDLLDDTRSAYIERITHLPIKHFLDLRKDLLKSMDAFRKHLETESSDILNSLIGQGIEIGDFAQGNKGIYAYWIQLSNPANEKFEPSDTVLKTNEGEYWHSSKCGKPKQALIAELRQQLQHKSDALLDFVERYSGPYTIEKEICSTIYATALLREISIRIDSIRNEQHTMHISEFNKRVAEIVMNEPAPFVYERLGEKYAHYLIDEFQDTSITQWQNLLPLVQNGLATASQSMLVGDGKQAIYRFRGGEVEQFITLPLPYPDNLNETQLERYRLLTMHHESVELDTNFRSRPNIVNWNNEFYKHLSDRLHANHSKLFSELNQNPKKDSEGGFVSVRFLTDKDASAAEYAELQGEEVLRLVRELLDERNYEPRDIAVLTRSNKHGSLLANLLLQQKIPVVSGESLVVKGKPEVQFLLAWLRVLSNNDVAINLLQICGYLIQHHKIPYSSVDKLLAEVRIDSSSVLEMLEKAGFHVQATTLKAQNLAEVVHNLIKVFEFDLLNDSFLQFFLEAVWFSSDQSNPDIPSFLTKWGEIEDKYSVTLPQNANAVRIMSVHKSKGLEFPVVILAFASNDEGRRDEFLWIDDPVVLPTGLPVMRFKIKKDLLNTPLKPYLEEEQSRKTLDRINLLYVASTRPENALYILSRFNKHEAVDDWGNFLKSFCAKLTADESGAFTWGDELHQKIESADASKKQSAPERNISYEIGNWRDKLSIAHSRNASFESEAIRMGNLVHTTLSWIRIASDFDSAIQRLGTSGLASENEIIEVQKRIELLFNNPDAKAFFNDFDLVYIERSLLLANGDVLRPDRVVVKGNKTTLIEYKSGKKEQKHFQQTTTYLETLRSMQTDQEFGAILVYFDNPLEIIAVA